MPKAQPVAIDEIRWDPKIYPRAKWSTSTIERYADALEAGDDFPPLVIEDNPDDPTTDGRLLDGKHRLEAYRLAGRTEAPAERHRIPDGMTAKYYAATLSARHGDRMSNADLRLLAREAFDPEQGGDPTMDATDWGRRLGIAKQTVHGWVGDLVNKGLEDRRAKALRLSRLGWAGKEIARTLEVSDATVTRDLQESESGLPQMREALAKGLPEAEAAKRWNLPVALVHAIALDELDDDADRLRALGIKVQPYDVWNFAGCHDLMGDAHPGRIPGDLVCHALYFWTNPGDLVVDPMAGSGTTLDACLLMGRKARGYDIDHRHDRCDVEQHDLSTGWPDTVGKARLIFWDPPYFDKMDHSTIGDDGYVEGSISGLDPDGYLDWLTKRFEELHAAAAPGARLAFLMSDWDPENAKAHGEHGGIFEWDYADRLRDSGWQLTRQIQVPLGTQQVHPDIVNKFRASRRLARLGRYLLVAEK